MQESVDVAASFITRDELLTSFDGDLDFLSELAGQFMESAPMEIDKIRSLLAAGEGAAASRAAHSLKGMTGYFVRGGAHTTAAFIEKIASSDLVAAESALPALIEGINEIRDHLNAEVLSCAAAS